MSAASRPREPLTASPAPGHRTPRRLLSHSIDGPGPLAILATAVVVLALSAASNAGPPPVVGPLAEPASLPSPSPRAAEAPLEPVEPLEPSEAVAATPEIAWPPTYDIPLGSRARVYDPPTEEERRLIEHAIHHCDKAAARFGKPFWKLELLRLEVDYGIPDELRGVTLAAWCGEAAYHLDGVVGDRGFAIGILQLHPHITRLCGSVDLRHDPLASAKCWLWNLNRVYAKAARRCRARDAWKAAELWLSQGGLKSGYSCTMVSGHVARLERWHRAMDRERRVASNEASR